MPASYQPLYRTPGALPLVRCLGCASTRPSRYTPKTLAEGNDLLWYHPATIRLLDGTLLHHVRRLPGALPGLVVLGYAVGKLGDPDASDPTGGWACC